jgi:hypothetical protein
MPKIITTKKILNIKKGLVKVIRDKTTLLILAKTGVEQTTEVQLEHQTMLKNKVDSRINIART